MLPFNVTFISGESAYLQVVGAVKRAIACGLLHKGDSFPSVRVLSQELKVSPVTAQKVVATLKDLGYLDVKPGIGTVICDRVGALKSSAKRKLLLRSVDELVVEAKLERYEIEDLLGDVRKAWDLLDGAQSGSRK